MTVVVVEGLIELAKPPPIDPPGLLREGVMIAGDLVVGGLDCPDHALVFIPLGFLSPYAVAKDQVAEVDD